MKTTLSEREGNAVKLAVEVSGDDLQEAFNTRLTQLSKEVRIPGFRQGKVPAAMVRQRVGDEAILADAIEEAMSGWFASAAIELGLDPVDRPQIELEGDAPELGKPLGFTASVTVMPEVVLGEYKGVEAPKEQADVEDQEVDAQMDRLRNEFAELRPVTGRAVQEGDFVTADFRAALDGTPVEGLEASDFAFEVGGGRIFPEIEEHVAGMNVGDERSFPLVLPEGSTDGDLGGKTVEFTLTLKETKEKVLPHLSDKWASEVSEFGTLLELRVEIRKKLQAARTYAVGQQFRSLAVKAVTDNATLDLPDVVVGEQAEEMVADFKQSLESQGGSLEAYLEATATTVEQMTEDMKPRAANNVKTGLVLDAVAKAEGIEARDDEVSAAVAQMAAAGRVDAKEFEARLRKSGRIETFKWQIVRDKAADFIVANAVAVAPQAEEPAAEEPAAAPQADEPVSEEPAAETTTEES
ncbi:MAG: trigger factor [bacterium]